MKLSSMVNETVFDNGLKIVSQQVPGMHSVSIGIWVAKGARSEAASEYGVAHFIEHLLFKGTKRRSARQITREIDSLGGILNAFTSYEYVCYYAKALNRNLPQLVDLLSDMFLNSTFPEEEIERERNVVLQEIKMRDDSPEEAIHDRLHQSFWLGHPLGHPILGDEDTIRSLGRDEIINFRDSCYLPGEIIIAAAGGVDHQLLVALLKDQFSELESGGYKQSINTGLPERNGVVFELCERELEQNLICLATAGVSAVSPDRFSFLLLNTILGGGMSSRLFEEIREKRGLAYSVYSYTSSFADAGALAVYAGTERKHTEDALQIMLGEMDRLRNELVPQDELEAAREQVKGKILMSLESSDSYMSRLARNHITFGRYQQLDEVMAGFNAVTADDIREIAKQLFCNRTLNVQIMGQLDMDSMAKRAVFSGDCR